MSQLDTTDLIRFIQEFRVNSGGMRFGEWLVGLLAQNDNVNSDKELADTLFYIEDYDLVKLIREASDE